MIEQIRRSASHLEALVTVLLALLFLLPAGAGATTWTVNVGQGGSHFVDPVTGTSTSRIVTGDTVHWVWVGGTHTTTSGNTSTCMPDGTWDSGSHSAPFSFDHTFPSSGTVPYYCTLHCAFGMTGTVIVSPPPTLTTVSPSSGPSAGGTPVTLTGLNFQTSGTTTVTFGATAATGVVVVNTTTITCTTPVHAPGVVDVTVINPDLGTSTLASAYTYTPSPAPLVTSVTPSSGPTAGGTALTIGGNNFQSGPGLLVTIGGNPATGVTWVDAMTIDAVTPAGVAGPSDVVVTNPDTQSGTLAGGFTYLAPPPPTVTSIVPDSSPSAGGGSVTITGADFVTGATVTICGAAATGVNVGSATQITATTGPATPGLVGDVVVTNPDAQTGTLANGFVYDYLDVTPAMGFHEFIIKIAKHGITGGCGNGDYCPNGPILRSQMSVFILRAAHGPTYLPPAANCATYPFPDVTCPSAFANFILEAFNEGIMGVGEDTACGAGLFCPNHAVTRLSMAYVLLRGEHGGSYVPPSANCLTFPFVDVPCPSQDADFVAELVAEGITGGCDPTHYCPTASLNRAQMAVFITVTFSLQ